MTPGVVVGEVMQKKRPTRGTPMVHLCVGGAVLYVKQPPKRVLGLPSRLLDYKTLHRVTNTAGKQNKCNILFLNILQKHFPQKKETKSEIS